jgi:hypothetical protein
MSLVPPTYTPSEPAPSYSPDPLPEEQSLLRNHRRTRRSVSTGTFVKRCRWGTLIFSEQEESADVPVYGRTGVVRGEIHLDDREKILSVAVKVSGVRSDRTLVKVAV